MQLQVLVLKKLDFSQLILAKGTTFWQFAKAQSVIEIVKRNEDKTTVMKLLNNVKYIKEYRLDKFKTDLQRLVDKTLVKGDTWFLVNN